MKKITLVIPARNEEKNIPVLYKEIKKYLPAQYSYEFIFVDDGSTDGTLAEIKRLNKHDKAVKYISFTRNFGHQYAIKAGLDFATSDAVITMDADLQHPPSLIPKMIAEWEKGAKIVNTKRRNNESWHKNSTSTLFYKLLNSMSETKIDPGAADFRLLSRDVVEFIKNSQESTLFLRGLFAWSGFQHVSLAYKPNKRKWGKTKYSYSKMMAFAADAFTSFSIMPLRVATFLGFVMALFSGLYGLYAIVMFFVNRDSVSIGWPSVIISVLFIGGIQLMILGILGEYIGKIFIETKNRPLYLIKDKRV